MSIRMNEKVNSDCLKAVAVLLPSASADQRLSFLTRNVWKEILWQDINVKCRAFPILPPYVLFVRSNAIPVSSEGAHVCSL